MRIFFFILATILLLFVSGTYYLLESSVPKKSGEVFLNDLAKNVEVYTDSSGIPHILAANETDAARVLGYLMGSERLFQMELFRRIGNGTLSEIFGEKGLKVDQLSRTLGFRHYLEKSYQKKPMEKKTKLYAEAFIDGLNQFIKQGILPWEFYLLRFKPKKYVVEDFYGMVGYMAYQFSSGRQKDLLMSRLLHELGEDAKEIFHEIPLSSSLKRHFERVSYQNSMQVFEDFKQFAGSFDGSNAWAIDGRYTESGKPILANDPHVDFSLPGLWFEANVITPNYSIYGHYVPPLPFPVLGSNSNHAWGLTVSYIDDMDFFEEKAGVLAVNKRVEVINVKGEDESITVVETARGPIVDDLFGLKNVAMSWTYFSDENRPFESLYQMGHVKSLKEFEQALKGVRSPSFNVIYANKKNEVGHFIMGDIPLRDRKVKSDFILDASNKKHLWKGLVSHSKKFKMVNPNSGMVISANNRPIIDTDYSLGRDFQEYDRYLTIYESLIGRSDWTTEEIKNIQTLNFNIKTKERLHALLSLLGEMKHPLKKILQSWDGQNTKGGKAPLIFHLWEKEVFEELFGVISKDLRDDFCELAVGRVSFLKAISNPKSVWWKGRNPQRLVLGALKSVQASLAKKGRKVSNWNWGSEHQLTISHPIVKNSFLAPYLSIGPIAVSGALNDINNFRKVGCKEGFSVKAGPSTRRVVSFGKGHHFGGLPLGNSGHPFSIYFDGEKDDFMEGIHRRQFRTVSEFWQKSTPVLLFKKK